MKFVKGGVLILSVFFLESFIIGCAFFALRMISTFLSPFFRFGQRLSGTDIISLEELPQFPFAWDEAAVIAIPATVLTVFLYRRFAPLRITIDQSQSTKE